MPELDSPYVVMLDVVADEGEMYAEYLRSTGFDVFVCTSRSEAFEAIHQRRPDAVVTRLRQEEPGVNGANVARQLKEDVDTEHVPILIITTSSLAEDRQAACDAHCDGYMLLPVLPEQLADEIRRVMHS